MKTWAVVRQFRLRWKREGMKEKRKTYWSEKAVHRRIALMGPEPWTALNKDPDEPFCCNGHMCVCGGETWREKLLGDRGNMPPLEYTVVESREVVRGDWVPNTAIGVKSETEPSPAPVRAKVSSCCGSGVRVAGGETVGATNWYECEKCGYPCWLKEQQ